MKIAIASSGLSHTKRGMEGWSEDIARGLYQKGIDVTLFKGSGPVNYAYEQVLPTFRRNCLPAKIIGKLTSKGGWRIGLGSAPAVESFFFGIQLLWHLRKGGYDLLHIKQASLAVFLLKLKKFGLVPLPIILSNGQMANEEFLSKFDYVQHLTPCLEKIDCAEINPESIPKNRFVIPNFIDTELFSPLDKQKCRIELGLPDKSKIILAVGAIKKHHKRMDYFIEEMASLESKIDMPLHFVIAGARDKETDEIIQMGKKRLGDRFSVFIDVPRNMMPKIFCAADVFVLCSLVEAFGTVLIEAMSCNIPVISNSHKSFEWIVQDGGYHIDMSKKGLLSDILEENINKGFYKFGDDYPGRKRVLSEFSLDVVVSKMIDMYREILNKEAVI